MKLLGDAGVYAIICLPTGRQYIGSTTRTFRRRFNQHRHDLRRGRAGSRKLQHAWSKYGESAFEFLPIEVCPAERALEREQLYIDILKPELNIAPQAAHGPTVHTSTSEFRKAASERARRMWARGAFRIGRQPDRDFHDVGGGRRLSVRQICEEFGLKKPTVKQRLRSGVIGAALVRPAERRFGGAR